MDAVTAAALSVGVTTLVAGGTAFYGYGRLNGKVDAIEKRHDALEARQTEDKDHLVMKIEGKADRGAFEELHKDVREVRDLVLQLLQRTPKGA